MINILIVEDNIALSDGIVIALKQEGYTFFQSFNINSARREMKMNDLDLILLDINLPDGNGLVLLKEIRDKISTPIIIITANDMETDIVMGLELGADDYITKPFSLMVLRARVNTQLRRVLNVPKKIIIDDFLFNFETMEFSKYKQNIELSKTEQKLLKILLENKGTTLSRQTLSDKIWTDSADYVDANALSVTIKRLRDKLEDNPSKPQYIKTIYGIGYMWVVR
ncbi:response regulator transcription factor [Clostridioides sp. ES-S-0001-02]|uniref:response regulator transcription factor n=1 Tax=Clostridioides sp. ES-S-0001-02 TaxID=2770770 RepID=UPI001D11A78F|nr:response regulator transcription factor [Clostridioides sp. ES-S-0001-02]